MDTRLFGCLLLLLFLVSQEIMMNSAEAALCQAPSPEYRGLCFLDSNCNAICVKNGFLFGGCQGFRRRCMCSKDCGGGGGGGGGDPNTPPEDPNTPPAPALRKLPVLPNNV
ncbi:unnamed protein product [Ilex paraguariensis]|uniref:Knottins-like domain-containing protein n=1 Tax=Ilex paraguariensis TaxID=185542 RepID=A0ABC8U4Y4_9AQUA